MNATLSATELALVKQIAELKMQLEAANKPRAITLKVTASKTDEATGKTTGTNGAISIYGLGRFPITLYRSQMERLIKAVPQIEAFIKTNEALLTSR
jgi:hypothetical protein